VHLKTITTFSNTEGYYKWFNKVHLFLFNRYHIDTLYNKIAYKFLFNSYILYKFVDQKLIEITGPAFARLIFSVVMRLWKLNMSNSNSLIYIQLGSMVISTIALCYVFGNFYF
jgi:hypothetical protein